ncbi:glutamate 5-kinase [Nisaea acidiphila]|uniref:Glutamate 5-kinase n=1 Tax=Nisaea acidiphila TaxID=1862145 RepID=A0A9J7ALN9_9PROT|nr:glutamate 5-kinase [Nisaea acidiphila]UUX48087.1 glutamate 5-kinase [Nisaea acidiphila]
MENLTRSGLETSERVVVKIGSALLVDEKGGEIRRDWLNALADDIANLKARGKQVLVVSSGAIAVGRRLLGLPKGALKLEDKQAAAATGQVRLAHAYQEALARHGITAAQILLSPGDTEERRRHLNARATLNALLALGAVPVINENDTVATEEIRYGDNDRLGARVAQMVSADTLILLSDIDGLYTADPRSNPAAEHIPHVERIDEGVEAMAGAVGSEHASGGMVTKLAAGKIASSAGCRMAIAKGHDPHPLKAIEEGARVTWFAAATSPRGARKNWIAGSLTPKGSVTLDEGALKALARGKSLLPAGVTKVSGEFERGDLIEILDPAGRPVARGLSAYGADDAGRIAGHKSREIERILGYRGRDELVHRDDLVLER